ncbi:hypothetical protein ACFUTU_19945 [Arthrobacter sp. NPDC057388]|uniref:hypothetical protein n=1 Tax=Arthrobacter sp. NPDC057388 TaxID=3346116 RepID=UPI003628C139
MEFSSFCIDGLHFTPDGSGMPAENTHVNGKTGIYVASANDSFGVTDMGFVYFENALTIHNADALSIHHNFIAECGSCIELRGGDRHQRSPIIWSGPAPRDTRSRQRTTVGS